MSLIIHYIKGFGYALKGVKHALMTDRSFRFQTLFIGPLVLIVAYVFWPLSEIEILFLGLGWILGVITEIQNTSMEAALDHLHPGIHEEIGHSKDMASGSVLLSGVFLMFVIIVIALT